MATIYIYHGQSKAKIFPDSVGEQSKIIQKCPGCTLAREFCTQMPVTTQRADIILFKDMAATVPQDIFNNNGDLDIEAIRQKALCNPKVNDSRRPERI